jgi:SpoVK/Ycf46/Vps4 family AAA+-type ATPase
VPFHAFIAFATNVKPSQLVDEAFLRRVRYKVFAGNPTIEEFTSIFEACCLERDLHFNQALVDCLLDGYYHLHGITRRGCHPRDLIDQALLLASYRDQPRQLTLALLEAACSSYFVEDHE